MKKYLAILMLGLVVLYSCDEEPLVFDNSGGQTLVNFGVSSIDLPIVIDATGSIDVRIDVSTVSDVDRTYNINVADGTTADPNSYSFPSSITIPAGSYNTVLTIDGSDVNVETTPEQLNLSIDTSTGDFLTDWTLAISVFQICPIPTTSFVGDYLVETITPGVFGASTYGGGIVTLEIGDKATDRVFEANYFEDGRFPRTFILELSCNEVVTPYQDHLVGCGGNDVNLSTAPANVNGTYDPLDDSEFIVNVTDNSENDCGGTAVQASYRFVKQ